MVAWEPRSSGGWQLPPSNTADPSPVCNLLRMSFRLTAVPRWMFVCAAASVPCQKKAVRLCAAHVILPCRCTNAALRKCWRRALSFPYVWGMRILTRVVGWPGFSDSPFLVSNAQRMEGVMQQTDTSNRFVLALLAALGAALAIVGWYLFLA